FKEDNASRPRFFSPLFWKLLNSDALFLESSISLNEDVKGCFWDYVKYFEASGSFAKGYNPSFIVLIPKKSDPLRFSDYRPISLIGCIYKVISKILSIRLAKVSILETCNKGVFKRVRHASSRVNISVLQFADDALFFGEWSRFPMEDVQLLSAWKAKSLSIVGRLTLIKSVHGFKDSQRGISWVKWKSMLFDPDKGGLGIGSIHATNLGLLGKWKWRFLTGHDALWRLVIREFYGEDGGFCATSNSSIFGGVWGDIIKASASIESIVAA
ncbi:hypothetical protein Tco_1011416, partial [Tanacetum coccineum]